MEITLLGCAVTLCLSGIMFDSPFLSDGSTPLRGVVLSYFSLSVIIFSILYFVLAFLFEIKQSKVKKKTKRQVLWSKLKGMKHKIVEDAKNEQKASKLQGLLSKSSKVNKVSPFNIKQMQSIIPKSSVTTASQLLEKKLNKSSSSSSSSSSDNSSSDNSSSESGISVISGNASLVDLLSGDSSEQNSSDGRSGDTKESSSSSSGSTSSAAVSSSDKSDSEVSYMPPSSSENEESSELEHESEGSNTSSESNMAAGDSDSDIEMVDNTSSSSNE